jgi:hypothetical protein
MDAAGMRPEGSGLSIVRGDVIGFGKIAARTPERPGPSAFRS